MYKRLIILSIIILAALCGLVWLGYHSLRIRAQGLEGARLGEFAAVAEQIRQDVTRNLDEFMQTEQNRPYTDYQYYYVPENLAPERQQMPVLRSPLAGRLEQGLAYGNFQIEPDGSVITPNDNVEQRQDLAESDNELYAEAGLNRKNIEQNLLPALSGTPPGSLKMNLYGRSSIATAKESETVGQDQFTEQTPQKGKVSQSYPIESLQSKGQKTQVIEQRREVCEQNVLNVAAQSQQQTQELAAQTEQTGGPYEQQAATASLAESQTETVQVRIEPFFPVEKTDRKST